MEGQRFLGIGDFIEDRKRVARRLLGSLRGRVAFDPTADKHADREHQARKYGTANQQKKDLSPVESTNGGQILRIDFWIAAPSAVDLRSAPFDFGFAINVHRCLSYPRCPDRGKFRGVRFTGAVGAVMFAAMDGKERSRS